MSAQFNAAHNEVLAEQAFEDLATGNVDHGVSGVLPMARIKSQRVGTFQLFAYTSRR